MKQPTGVAYLPRWNWVCVANSGDGTVSRIDPAAYGVAAKIEVGGRPSGVAVGSGGVWVTVQAPLQTGT